MEHLPLALFLVSIMISFWFIGLFGYLNYKYDYPLLRFHLIMMVANSLYIILQSVGLYGFLNTEFFPDLLSLILSNVAISLSFIGFIIYYQGRTTYFLISREWSRGLKSIYLVVSCIPPALAFFGLTQDDLSKVSTYVGLSMGVFLGNQIYLWVLLLKNYRGVRDPLKKYISLLILILPLIAIPIGLLDGYFQNSQILAGKFPQGVLAQPLILLINNLAGLAALLKARSLQTSGGGLPSGFLLEFQITPREAEIIEMIRRGLSNKEIAGKLFLSPSTVRNHISNIFDKTGASTRTKLLHLIDSRL